jgi:hypothetical protein
MNVKQDTYIPHFLSLGPYHHYKVDTYFESSSVGSGRYQYPELKMSTVEAHKIESTTTLWHRLHNHVKSLNNIVEKIEGMQ